jgi:thiol-disulfide isomerase/thioredoxin
MRKTIKKIIVIFTLLIASNNYLSEAGTTNNKVKKVDISKLNFKTFNKKKINLSAPIVIINFWATWCGPCLEELPSLVALRKKFPEDKLSIIAINEDHEDIEKNIKKTIKKFNLNFSIVTDENDKYLDFFYVKALPVTFLFNNGKIVKITNGATDFSSIEYINELNSMLNISKK